MSETRSNLLQAELSHRAMQGMLPVSIAEFESRLRAIGYRRDRSTECRSLARYMTGEHAGRSYPSCDTNPVEMETGLRWINFNASRGPAFERLKALRDMFAVTADGYILEF